MEQLPVLNIILAILFSGFITYSILLNLYRYFRLPQNETPPLTLFNGVAFIYIISNAIVLYFSFFNANIAVATLFMVIKELSLLLFLIVTPYFIDKIMELKPGQKIFNRVLFWAGIASALIIGSIIIISPDILINCAGNGNPGNYSHISCCTKTGPLQIIRDVVLILYLLYMIIQILLSEIYIKSGTPIKNILIGLIVLCYFALTYIYKISFYNNHIFPYPHIALGIVLCILFMNFESVDLSVFYIKQLNTVKNDLNRILYYDAALEIPNRIGFINDLQAELVKTEASGGKFSLIFIDIDDFHSLNECFGQHTGNEILKMLSKRLTEYFTYIGTLYRTGGDEFVLLLKSIKSEEEAKSLAMKIISSLRNSFSVSGSPYTITASLGILQIPKDGKDVETIINNGYAAINNTKKIKNTFSVFKRELTDNSLKKINIINLLRSSINKDQFTLFYQPIVDSNKKIKHVETLLRCTNTDPAIGGPGVFIPLLEEAGLMNDIDNMVLRKAFHDMEMRIKKKVNISINLSANQVVNPVYSDFLSSFTKQHGLDNRQIILEVTESTLIQNMSAGRENLLKLKDKGFIIAIDDFGKGFSSLTYLAELPVDILKMDMVFVHSVPGDCKKEAMVKHIIEMAHSLDLKIIAEGFELREQVNFFKELGCDFYQGYFFSKPLPLDELLSKYLG